MYLVLTLDYEIFGNGSGDVRQHMVEPTERMARVCEKRGVPLTIFFEAEEYLAFCRYARELERKLGYDPAGLIREQVRSLARRGHDFQLHLHPQWYGARLGTDGWVLRPEWETVDHLFEGEDETVSYIRERKELLEHLTGGVCQPRAYRAGAFSARPGKRLLHALARNDIRFDSSVVRGLFRRSGDYVLDYRHVQSQKRLWRVRDDVTSEAPDGPVWEVPIHSVPVRRYQQLTFSRLQAKFSRTIPEEQKKQMAQRFFRPSHPLKMLKTLFEPVPLKLDFHNQSPEEFCRTLAVTERSVASSAADVVVAIGHSKEHLDDEAFDRLLTRLKGACCKIITFGVLSDSLNTSDSLPVQQKTCC